MSAVVWHEAPSLVVADVTRGLRTINIGIVGLGQVGQAVARLATEATRLNVTGLRFRAGVRSPRD